MQSIRSFLPSLLSLRLSSLSGHQSLSGYRGQRIALGVRRLCNTFGDNDPLELFNEQLCRLTRQQKLLSHSVMTMNNLFRAMPTQSQEIALDKVRSSTSEGWKISPMAGQRLAVGSLTFITAQYDPDQPMVSADADPAGVPQTPSPVNDGHPSTVLTTAPASCRLTNTGNSLPVERSGEILLPEKVIRYPEGIAEIHFSASGDYFLIVRRNILEIWGKASDGQWVEQGLLRHSDRVLWPCFNAQENAVLVWSLGGHAKILGQNPDGSWSDQGSIKYNGNNTPWVMARFSHSGNHILSASLTISNSEAHIWARDGHGQWSVKARLTDVKLDTHRRGLFTGSSVSDRHILSKSGRLAQIWSSANGWLKPRDIYHNDTVCGTYLSASERHALTYDYSGVVKLFDYQQGWSEVGEINHGAGVAEAIFSDDGRFVLTVSDNTDRVPASKIWQRDGSWSNLASITHRSGVKFARFLANNHVLSCGLDGKVVICCERPCGSETVRVEHTGPVTSVVISPSGKQLLTCSEDGTAKLMHCDQSGCWSEQAVIHHHGVVLGGCFSSCGHSVMTFGADNSARLWAMDDFNEWQERAVIHHNKTIYGAQFSPSGALAVTFSEDGTAVVCSGQTGQNWQRQRVIDHGAPVRAVSFNATEEWLVTSGNEFDDKVWLFEQGDSNRGGVLMMPPVRRAKFGQGYMLTLAKDNTAVVWSIGESRP